MKITKIKDGWYMASVKLEGRGAVFFGFTRKEVSAKASNYIGENYEVAA